MFSRRFIELGLVVGLAWVLVIGCSADTTDPVSGTTDETIVDLPGYIVDPEQIVVVRVPQTQQIQVRAPGGSFSLSETNTPRILIHNVTSAQFDGFLANAEPINEAYNLVDITDGAPIATTDPDPDTGGLNFSFSESKYTGGLVLIGLVNDQGRLYQSKVESRVTYVLRIPAEPSELANPTNSVGPAEFYRASFFVAGNHPDIATRQWAQSEVNTCPEGFTLVNYGMQRCRCSDMADTPGTNGWCYCECRESGAGVVAHFERNASYPLSGNLLAECFILCVKQ